VDLNGEHTKNGKPASQPVPKAFADELRAFLVGRPKGTPVWPGTWAERSAYVIQTDAAAAGLPLKVESKDGTLSLDFHTLRGTFATILDGLDISLKARQELMRNSDPRLTMNRYTRTRLHDLKAAADRFPALSPPDRPQPEPVRQELFATAMHDTIPTTNPTTSRLPYSLPSLALVLALNAGSGGGAVRANEEMTPPAPIAGQMKKP
jgi:hypothetical protein